MEPDNLTEQELNDLLKEADFNELRPGFGSGSKYQYELTEEYRIRQLAARVKNTLAEDR